MDVTVQSNPRKLYRSGNGVVVSFPTKILEAAGFELGDQVVMEADEGEITIRRAEWEVSD